MCSSLFFQERPFKCQLCDAVFESEQILGEHGHKAHCEILPPETSVQNQPDDDDAIYDGYDENFHQNRMNFLFNDDFKGKASGNLMKQVSLKPKAKGEDVGSSSSVKANNGNHVLGLKQDKNLFNDGFKSPKGNAAKKESDTDRGSSTTNLLLVPLSIVQKSREKVTQDTNIRLNKMTSQEGGVAGRKIGKAGGKVYDVKVEDVYDEVSEFPSEEQEASLAPKEKPGSIPVGKSQGKEGRATGRGPSEPSK